MNNFLKYTTSFAIAGMVSVSAFAQQAITNEGWHQKDLKKDKVYGISLQQAYEFLNAKKVKSTPVIVGIIDSGIDTTHEALKSVLWVNKKEIPGNGIDDDGNGYIDDINGWNFLGSRNGKTNVTKDSYEAARVYWKHKAAFEGKTADAIPADQKAIFKEWERAKKDVIKDDVKPAELPQLKAFKMNFSAGNEVIKKDLKKEVYSCKDLANYTPTSAGARNVVAILNNFCQGNDNNDLTNKIVLDEIQKEIDKIEIIKAPPMDYRGTVVMDNYADFNDKYYGNGNVYVEEDGALHGTHVAGIVGALRGNGKHADGVADNVQLMALRAVPDGDEHDKDIALAIRYAVDNGARVINMSFGKSFSPEKQWVDDAIKYADKKGVLMIHAAGNDKKDIDVEYNFPSATYLDGGRPKNWITVGASSDPGFGDLTADFTNFGKKEVDLFSPGVKIYATAPGGDKYQFLQGTSMASPVVAGVAALVMSYYPNLSATQVKEILEKSAVKPAINAKNPKTGDTAKLSDLSVTGGIVNALEAVKLADTMSKGGKPAVATKKTVTKKKVVRKK